MKQPNMHWQRIATLDPFLAGALACRERREWDEVETAEQQAESVGLSGEAQAKFLAGWQYERELAEQEGKEAMAQERDALAREAAKGDPAR